MKAGRSILQREIKESDKNKRKLVINNPNQGNILVIGKTGYGKSGTIGVIVENLFDLRYIKPIWKVKIFDLFDGGRGENMFYLFPNNNLLRYGLDRLKKINYMPKSYPCTILYPNSKYLPNKIPPQGRVFTIPIHTLNENDLQALIGKDLSTTIKAIWNGVFKVVDKNTTAEDFKQLILSATGGDRKNKEDVQKSIQARRILDGALGKLIDNKLLTSGKVPLAIDLKSECEDVDNISVLSLKYIDKSLHGFLVNYFINHVFDGLSMNRIKPPVATYFILREVRELLNTDIASQSEYAIRESLSKVLRMWRTNKTGFVMDNQLQSALTKDAASLPQKVLIFQSDEVKSVLDSFGYGARGGVLTSSQIIATSMLPRLHCYVIDKDKVSGGAYLVKINPPKHRLHNTGERFDDIYNNLIGIWKYVGKDKEIDNITSIEKENSESREKWKLKKAMKFQTKDAGKELIKQFKKIEKSKEKESDNIEYPKNTENTPKTPKNTPKKAHLETQDKPILDELREIYPHEIDVLKEPIKVNGSGIEEDDESHLDELNNKDSFEEEILKGVEELNKKEEILHLKDDNSIKVKKLEEYDIDDFDKAFIDGLKEEE